MSTLFSSIALAMLIRTTLSSHTLIHSPAKVATECRWRKILLCGLSFRNRSPSEAENEPRGAMVRAVPVSGLSWTLPTGFSTLRRPLLTLWSSLRVQSLLVHSRMTWSPTIHGWLLHPPSPRTARQIIQPPKRVKSFGGGLLSETCHPPDILSRPLFPGDIAIPTYCRQRSQGPL